MLNHIKYQFIMLIIQTCNHRYYYLLLIQKVKIIKHFIQVIPLIQHY